MLEYIKVVFKEVVMKLYAPKYYRNFKCIANKCNHSCCIGWEINIDKLSLDKYNALKNSYSEIIRQSINYNDNPHFNLNANGKCFHLNEQGLCNIILNCGEDYLCHICREHPRFYNFTNSGKEIGIGMSCEAACNIILESDDYDKFIEIANISGNVAKYEYDALIDRYSVFKILKQNLYNINNSIELISTNFDIHPQNIDLKDLISKFEYLYCEDKLLFSLAPKLIWNASISPELTRILAYYVYRYCSESYDYNDFCISLSFAIICTGLVSTLANKSNIKDIARIVSEEIEYSEENVELIKSLFY